MMDILKRIDHAMEACRRNNGFWSIDSNRWAERATPELLDDISQYIESLQLKLMHEQAATDHERSKAPAWRDAPDAPGLWVSSVWVARYFRTGDLANLVSYPNSPRWYGPIPSEDKP